MDNHSSLSKRICNVVAQFPDLARRWHQERIVLAAGSGIEEALVALHALNFAIWHHEDQVRRQDVADAQIVWHKRRIDQLNAQRNTVVEVLDSTLVEFLPGSGELHSETPGMLLDRLSILDLRLFHVMAAQLGHDYADVELRKRVLEEQRQDLTLCLVNLLEDLQSGRKRFRVYRQFKSGLKQDCPLFEGGQEWLQIF